MNIFILDRNPELSVQYYVDKHIIKMPLETAQLLCTAHRILDPKSKAPYKIYSKNHPCSKWTYESHSNYLWLCNLGTKLCEEFYYRYDKLHSSYFVIKWCEDNIPRFIDKGITPFVQAMPKEYRLNDPIEAYRRYYNEAKRHLFKWTRREQPWWIIEETDERR